MPRCKRCDHWYFPWKINIRVKFSLLLMVFFVFVHSCPVLGYASESSSPIIQAGEGTVFSFAFILQLADIELMQTVVTEQQIGDHGNGPISAPQDISPYFSTDLDYYRTYCYTENAHIAGLASVLYDFNNSIEQNRACFDRLITIIASLEYDSYITDDRDENKFYHDYFTLSEAKRLFSDFFLPTMGEMINLPGESTMLYDGRYNYYAIIMESGQILCFALCDGFQFDDSAFDLHVAVLNADIAALQQAKANATNSAEAGRLEIELLRKQLELAELLYQ